VNYDYYDKVGRGGKKEIKTDAELDEEIGLRKKAIGRAVSYLKALAEGMPLLDKPGGEGEDLKSNITDFLMSILKEKMSNDEDEKKRFEKIKSDLVFIRTQYRDKDDGTLSRALISTVAAMDRECQKEIDELEQQKLRNKYAEEVNVKVNSLPAAGCAEKVLKYEKALQKSIVQNLSILKRLQSIP
jgi:hypothetical protein